MGKSDFSEEVTYFKEQTIAAFTRKDYMSIFKNISSATASRDLNKGIEMNYFVKIGDKNKTKYRLKK